MSAVGVKGTGSMLSQADEGLKLFSKDPIITFDTVGASNFKMAHEAGIQKIEAQAEKLTGKPNAKARSELGKQVQAMKADPMYIDACKVVKGLEAPYGNFMTKVVQQAEKPSGGYSASNAPTAPEQKKKSEKEKK